MIRSAIQKAAHRAAFCDLRPRKLLCVIAGGLKPDAAIRTPTGSKGKRNYLYPPAALLRYLRLTAKTMGGKKSMH
mgnify:CR=1 FL=1